MRLKGLMQPIKDCKIFKNTINSIKNNAYPIGVYGLSDSAKNYFIGALYEELNKPLLIVTHNDVEAKNFYEDLSFYTPQVHYFPSKDVVFYNLDAISGDLRWERLKVLREIINIDKKIVIISADALVSAYTPVEIFKNFVFKLSVGQILDIEDLKQKLISSGYERIDIVDNKGQFSIRGGIIDIFPPNSFNPYRIELFDDEIDSIRTFNQESQRSIEKVNTIEICPAKEIVLNSDSIREACSRIEKDLASVTKKHDEKNNKNFRENISNIINANLQSLRENWTFETIDSYLPYFYNELSEFLDYVKNYFIIIDDIERCKGKIESVYYEFDENYKSFLERGSVLPEQGKLLTPKDSIFQRLSESEVITLSSIAKSTSILKPRSINSFSQLSLYSYQGKLEYLIEDIKHKKEKGNKILILCGTRPRGERLVNTLKEYNLESSYKDTIDDIKSGQIVITFGNQQRGFEFPELNLSVISDKEVFGEFKRRAKKKIKAKGAGKIKSFTELKPGDYVVHANHGIGIYKGIKQLEVQGLKKDYLDVRYHSGDTLYVPVEQLDLVQKYIGSEGKAPKVNKLGGTEWNKTKNKVKNSINDIAEDLVKLYAARATLKGHRFSKDTIWQKQFEEEFPYEETPDQVGAIEDIKQDMESEKPMDRLLCGDVGYGKTEVAIRAAFKAVMDGKQVAILVPTTILAEQHYNNLVKRFSDFPIKIDMVSRFRTSAKQKDTLKDLSKGNIDIIIGTHRLLQKDVAFKDLGLLVVDEEQRFGVTHKEKIKNLRKNVDVLTLTATPIPRTLHMSLVGVRDISVIDTPPEDRYPIQTYVVEFNEQLVYDAVMREISRGGQVYFVYNRVEKIKDIASYLAKLIPNAKIAVAHGQMTERELENIMIDFMNNEYNILICTTIIETGIDIPNVNTMIIYNADKMGLSQLYQLRGRVGRTNRIAYAYFTYKKDKVLTEVAEKRLKAIKEFTELGSGFKIAMRDLEIRGAGNMMGSAQHGHMASVGYDLYCRMLEGVIKEIKGEIDKEPIETAVELKIDAYIPNEYIKDEIQKIEIYKKIAAIDSYEDKMDIIEEIEDRFSDIPFVVYNLIDVSYIRCLAKKLNIEEISETNEEIFIKFADKNVISEKFVTGLLDKYNKQVVFKLGEKPSIGYKINDVKKDELLKNIKELLEFIGKNVERKK